MTETLVVSEVFGPTFQGEGPSTGQRVAFVRTGGCNLHCSWCDTPYTWDASRYDLRAELSRRDVHEVADEALACEPHRIVVSGGEPLMHQHQPGWVALLERFGAAGVPVEVETNGTLVPSGPSMELVSQFNVSPKLAHAGDPASRRLRIAPLRVFSMLASRDAAALKIVVQRPHHVAVARRLADVLGWPLSRVWVMPEGITAEALLARHAEVADAALAHGLNFTTRLHVLTWGEERGR